jgi:hypothetical protein
VRRQARNPGRRRLLCGDRRQSRRELLLHGAPRRATPRRTARDSAAAASAKLLPR